MPPQRKPPQGSEPPDDTIIVTPDDDTTTPVFASMDENGEEGAPGLLSDASGPCTLVCKSDSRVSCTSQQGDCRISVKRAPLPGGLTQSQQLLCDGVPLRCP